MTDALSRRVFLSVLGILSAPRARAADYRVWPIWSEGYLLEGGGHAVADYLGSGIGRTFVGACESRFRGDRDFELGSPPTWCGRVLFKTEAEARRSYG